MATNAPDLAATGVDEGPPPPGRRGSEASDGSRTAADFLQEQMQLEADAREAMPYSTDLCTYTMGPLRQAVYACLTCNPPPSSPAGMCYACSVQCHGEHTLVEIFQKRNFTCDCGTARFPATTPCALRPRGGGDDAPAAGNRYNQNFANRFCGCSCDYDPFDQKGTMFQCLGLGTAEQGGCGEDWWHPGCLVGMGPRWFEGMAKEAKVKMKRIKKEERGELPVISEEAEEVRPEQMEGVKREGGEGNEVDGDEEDDESDDDEPPMPPGFPNEDDFEGFLCYKCVDAHPWIRQYAGAPGFLPAVFAYGGLRETESSEQRQASPGVPNPRKRKADDLDDANTNNDKNDTAMRDADEGAAPKRQRSEAPPDSDAADTDIDMDTVPKPPTTTCKLSTLPSTPRGSFSLFFTPAFRTSLCHCPSCTPLLQPHPQLLAEEDVYEPPLSSDGSPAAGSVGSASGGGSLYERGESALRNVDRVRAIEGVMAYNQLKERLKPFFAEFAGSGRAIGADDIKEYFAKLRGDDGAIEEARRRAAAGGGEGDDEGGYSRREQSGY